MAAPTSRNVPDLNTTNTPTPTASNVTKHSKAKSRSRRLKYSGFIIMPVLVLCEVFNIVRTSQIHLPTDLSNSFEPRGTLPIPVSLARSNASFQVEEAHSYHDSSQDQDHHEHGNHHKPALIGMENFEPCSSLKEVQTATIDEEYMFWWDGQPKLCRLIRRLKGGVDHIQDPGRPVLLNLRVNCTNLTLNNGLGTGNWIIGFYMMRIAAAFASVHLKFDCSAGNYKTEILPFLQGCYAPTTERWPPFQVTEKLMCDWEMRAAPLHLAAFDIQDAMRHLVKSATGFQRPTLSMNLNTTMFGEVTFDEVAIHFRCGDILNLTNPRGDYGFTRYSEYRRRISPTSKSIGLITQSFDKSRNRKNDQDHTTACSELANLLVERFEEDFPKANVNIRNGPSETMTLAYIRLAVAEQSIIGLSSFGAFPILANYGTSYFVEGRQLVNKWLNLVPDMMNNMIVMKNPDLLRNTHIMKKGINFTKQWIVG